MGALVHFPTARKRAYVNPRLSELPPEVSRLPAPKAKIPHFPANLFAALLFSSIDTPTRAALLATLNERLSEVPDDTEAQAVKWWVRQLPWRLS